MKYWMICMLCVVPTAFMGQIDVEYSNVTLIGFGIKNTTHHGILAKSPLSIEAGQYVANEFTFPDFHARGSSMDCRHIEFGESSSISVSWESIVYYVGELLNDKTESYTGPFRFIAGQPTEELKTDELPLLTEKQKRWINLRFLEANSTFGVHAIQFGFHLSLREFGYDNFSTYDSENREYRIMNGANLNGKLLLGPAIGFRKSINDLSILAYASVSGSLNQSDEFQLKYSPHAEATVFYGKKIGVFGSAYYRQFVGKDWMDQNIAFNANFNEFSLHFGLYFCTGE